MSEEVRDTERERDTDRGESSSDSPQSRTLSLLDLLITLIGDAQHLIPDVGQRGSGGDVPGAAPAEANRPADHHALSLGVLPSGSEPLPGNLNYHVEETPEKPIA